MSNKLKDRIDSYIALSNYKLMPKLPIIITVNMKTANKISALLDKPYSERFMEALCSTLIRLLQEIDGSSVFGYVFSDEMVIVARNDQSKETKPWSGNYIQKIVSVMSSIATSHFNMYAASIGLELLDVIFITNVFAVPNTTEAINVIVSKQQQNIQSSIQFACLYELLKKGFNKNDINELANELDIDQKIELLYDECGVVFNDYPLSFRRGIACYKQPQIIKYGEEEIIKDKWQLDIDLPLFSKEQALLKGVFKA